MPEDVYTAYSMDGCNACNRIGIKKITFTKKVT